jgi:hypothetical protein
LNSNAPPVVSLREPVQALVPTIAKMRYVVRVSDGRRFELTQYEPIVEGQVLRHEKSTFKVEGVHELPPGESDDFDAVVEAVWVAGRPQAWLEGSEL